MLFDCYSVVSKPNSTDHPISIYWTDGVPTTVHELSNSVKRLVSSEIHHLEKEIIAARSRAEHPGCDFLELYRIYRIRNLKDFLFHMLKECPTFWVSLGVSFMFTVRVFLLQTLLKSFLLFGNFVEFPNRRRPKCTTMPWNIWPSLVVLWGVCWMFYAPPVSHSDETPYQFLAGGESYPLFGSDTSLNFTPSAFLVGQFPDNFDGSSSDFNNIETYSYGELHRSNPDLPRQISFLDPGFPEAGILSTSHMTLFDTSLNDNTIQLDYAGDLVLGARSVFVGSTSSEEFDQIPFSGSSESTHSNSYSMVPLSTITASNTLPMQTLFSSQTSIPVVRYQSPPLNERGEIICNHYGCSNTDVFGRKCDWQKHMNQHTRPFRCTVNNCDRTTAGFATKDELKRHIRAHDRQNKADTDSLFYCAEPDCPRYAEAGGEGFTRKDHLREHVRRSHRNSELPASLVPRSSEQMGQSITIPNMKKRKHTLAKGGDEGGNDNGEEDLTSQDDLKKARLREREGDDLSFMPQSEQRLIKENMRLEKQLERSERETERSDREIEGLEKELEKCREINKRLLESLVG